MGNKASAKKKKSTTKYSKRKQGRVPLLVPVIAMIEVIILIAVSTYAWYYLNYSKSVTSGVITVEADAGLDIDFREAKDQSYINIWNYIDKDFAFEPATSIDGRNIYFPTSGTFNSTNTTNMTFREGTVNDINSKYINIDFELTNTNSPLDSSTPEEMEVYLSSKSQFIIKEHENDNVNDDELLNGSALRLAFYNNDGNYGNVGSTMVQKMATSKNTITTITVDEDEKADVFTVYYYRPQSNYTPYVYYWHAATNVGTDTSDVPKKSWPGIAMNRISGNLFYYSFKNPYTLADEDDPTSAKTYYYDKVKFSNGYSGSGNASNDFVLTNEKVYDISKSTDFAGDTITLKTVYFLKPSGWGTPVCVPRTTQDDIEDDEDTEEVDESTKYYLTNTGMSEEAMTEVTPGIYSYTVPTDFPWLSFMDSGSGSGGELTVYTIYNDIRIVNNKTLYYSLAANAGGMTTNTLPYSEGTVFFYNTYGWDVPHACVTAFVDSDDTFSIPMIALSGNVFYCTVPMVYLYNFVDGNTDIANSATKKENCKVFFGKTDDVNATTDRTEAELCKNNYIYRPLSTKSTYWDLLAEDYGNAAVGGNDQYAVISPGVSAGFQRSANPVNAIDNETGEVKSIIPAFATSFDDYIYGSGNPVFKIRKGETVSMSMIIWLEGTDTHCTTSHYSGKYIDLYLEFVTSVSATTGPEPTYKVHFVDSTEQIWTSDTITNKETKVSVNPVIQLYDYNIKRGYLMDSVSTASYGGKQHTDVWECVVPRSVIADGHRIEFRRVNPYNEDEIWNRWEAGPCNKIQDYIKDAEGAYTFTAFADGSPDYEMYKNEVVGLPEKSCGGLWGSFKTDQLVVYDGRFGDDRDIETTGNTLTIQYTYTYPNNETATIEYRSAGTWRDVKTDEANNWSGDGSYRTHFYSFIVPSTVYERSSKCCFKQYSGFNDKYAFNSTSNNKLELERVWYTYDKADVSDIGRVGGNFFEFNEEEGIEPDANNHTERNINEHGYHSYWGSDVIYVQVKHDMDKAFNTKWVQMHFSTTETTGASADIDDGDQFYSYLSKDDNYKYANDDYGAYVAVIPSDKQYRRYRVETTPTTDHSTISYNMKATADTGDGSRGMDYHEPEYASDNSTVLFYHNSTCYTYTNETTKTLEYKNWNIYTIEHRCAIYFSRANWGESYNSPRVHWWMTGSGWEVDANFPIVKEGWYETSWAFNNSLGQPAYRTTGIPQGADYQFYWGSATFENATRYSVDVSGTYDGMEKYPTGGGSSSADHVTLGNGSDHRDVSYDSVSTANDWLYTRRWDSKDYGGKCVPHYDVPTSALSSGS